MPIGLHRPHLPETRRAELEDMAYKEAVRLACVLHAKHYPELKDWKPLDDLRGVISQIDNLTCGLVKERY